MAKVTDLPMLANPIGDETVPAVRGGRTYRARVADLVQPKVTEASHYAAAAAAMANRYPTFANGAAATANGTDFTVVDDSGKWINVYRKGTSADADHPVIQLPGKASFEGAGGAGMIGSASPVAPGIVRSAQSMFEGSPDLLDIIGGSEKARIRDCTSTVAIDDALDDYIAHMGRYQKKGLLRMSGGRAVLNRGHTLNTKSVQLGLSGEFDMRGIPDNTIAFIIKGGSLDDLGSRSTSRAEISGLSILGPGGTQGPTWGRGCTAIKYVDCDHLLIKRLTIRDFVTGITNGDNAYMLEHLGGRISGCVTGYHGAQAVNAGERVTFSNFTVDAMRVAWKLANAFSDLFLFQCSGDYPVNLSIAGKDTNVRFIEVDEGRLSALQCHFEGGNSGNPMGGVSPFFQGASDSTSCIIRDCEIVFGQNIIGVPVFENLNPAKPMIVDGYMINGYGYDGVSNGIAAPRTALIAKGNIEPSLRTVRGAAAPLYGPTFIGGLSSRFNNKFTGLANLGLAEDGTANTANGGITSGTIGANIRLVASGAVDANGVPQVYAQKTSALGVLATFNIAVPISGNALVGFETFLTKTAALTGEISMSAVYVAAHRQGDYVLIVDRVGGTFADGITVDLATLSSNVAKRIAFGGISRRADAWATHAIVSVSMRKAAGSTDAANPAQLFLSGTCVTEIK